MPKSPFPVRSVAVPAESRIANVFEHTCLVDAYEVRLPHGTSADPETLARFVMSQQAPWMVGLMRARDALVAGFGLKTSRMLTDPRADGATQRIGIFRIYETHPDEIVLGEDDKHLDFRLSLMRQTPSGAAGNEATLTLSTSVHCHNALGRSYILLIAPFHRSIVQAMLRRATRAGWPQRASV